MSYSKIEWTETTWNPVSGCTKISSGCQNCYAERMAQRLKAMGLEKYKDGFKLTLHSEVLDEPASWKTSRTVFVCSMSDLFHEDVPLTFIQSVFKVMSENPQHVFQVLTKRADRLLELSSELPWPDHIWAGVTVEDNDNVHRIARLRQIPAKVKFLSLEPLLGPIANPDFHGINWVIVGGESGPASRPIQQEWVTDLRDYCFEQGILFFFKQWGGKNKKKAGRLLQGKIWDQMPGKRAIA